MHGIHGLAMHGTGIDRRIVGVLQRCVQQGQRHQQHRIEQRGGRGEKNQKVRYGKRQAQPAQERKRERQIGREQGGNTDKNAKIGRREMSEKKKKISFYVINSSIEGRKESRYKV